MTHNESKERHPESLYKLKKEQSIESGNLTGKEVKEIEESRPVEFSHTVGLRAIKSVYLL